MIIDNQFAQKALGVAKFLIAIFAIWFFIRFALSWFLPFIAAFVIARGLEPVVRLMMRKLRFPRALAAILCTLLAFALIVSIVVLSASRLVYELGALGKRLTELPGGFNQTLTVIMDKVQSLIDSAPEGLQVHITSALQSLPGKTAEIAGSVSKWIFSFLSVILSAGPKVLFFCFTCALSTFFISSEYPKISEFLARQIPEKHRQTTSDLKTSLRETTGKWLRAQLMMSAVTCVELFIAFTIMRIDIAVLLAFIIALVDMLPLLGTGSVLIPWAIVDLILGNYTRAITLMVTFVVVLLVRNILEPKLVAGQLGLPPIAALTAMYAGYSIAGIFGMALFPIGLIMVKQLNDRGYVKLWR